MEKQKNVPELRFPEFEGEWERKKFGEIATNRSGKYNPEKEINSIKCIELEHLASETAQLLGYVDGKNSGSIKNKFDSGDVLFGKLRPYLKKYLLAPFEGVCSSEIWVLKGTKILNEFLFRIVQTNNFIDLANQSSGSKMPRADWSVVENGLFSFPTLPEQSKIATFLTAVDEKLQALKKKKSLLEVYKKGVMQKLFSQELRFKSEDGKEFGDWEEKKLGEVCDRITTKNKENNTNVLTISAQIGLISQLEFFNKSVSAKNVTGYYLLHNNDFAYNKSYSNGYPMGAIKRLKRYVKGVVSTLYICFRFNDSINLDFMEQYFEMGLQNVEIEKVAQEGARNHGLLNIGVSDFLNIGLILPSHSEQTLIANFLSSLDEKINHTQTEITKTEVWKKGLLQKMFV
ncbi:MAG: restriction endonuclease subunit S [Saprospiraceae bacterium]|nr:restriction endonuclease subunit S [Candidatus Brachybacter algidus]